MGPGGSIQAQSLRGRFKPQGCLVGAEQASGRERDPAAGVGRAVRLHDSPAWASSVQCHASTGP